MSIVDKFDALMSHLNSEENSMAEEFKAELQKLFPETPTTTVVKYNITKVGSEPDSALCQACEILVRRLRYS